MDNEQEENKVIKRGNKRSYLNLPASRLTIFIQKYFYFFVLLEVIAILGAGYWYFLKPKIDNIYQSASDIALQEQELENKIQNYENKINNLKEVRDSYLDISEEDTDKINKILPDQSETKELLLQINDLSEINGLLLKNITFVESGGSEPVRFSSESEGEEIGNLQLERQAGANVGEVALELKLASVSYLALKSFLNSLEDNMRLIDVESVKFDPDGETAEIILRAYYLL